MKLAIGTAQFGLNYGAFNDSGKISRVNVSSILSRASAHGIDLLDSAQAYGVSESVLGSIPASQEFKIVTKCPALTGIENPEKALARYFQSSLERLGAEKIYGYLLHRSEDLEGEHGKDIWRVLCGLRDSGKVKKIGISAYSAEELINLLQHYPMSLVQIPAHALCDWYFSAQIAQMREQTGIEIHSRSTFLQGFLLSDPEQLRGYFAKWRSLLIAFRARAKTLGLTPLQAALGAVYSQPAIDKIIVGVDSEAQLCEIIAAIANNKFDNEAFRDIVSIDQGLVDPRQWKV